MEVNVQATCKVSTSNVPLDSKFFGLEAELVEHLVKFVSFASTTFFPRQPSYAESCSIWKKFGKHIMEVIE